MNNFLLMFLTPFTLSSNPTYTQDIKPIFKNRCSKCHDSMANMDWQKYSIAFMYKNQIKQKVSDREMPAGSYMPQTEVDLIVKWVDEGAKE